MATALTLPQFSSFRSNAHAFILVGVHGHSSIYEAIVLAMQLAGKKGIVQHLKKTDDKTGIAISQVRELYSATRSRSGGVQRVWIIEDAEAMSLDAQNAFLKLLEEPPADTIFILCVKEATSLLATIRSRAQHIQCQPIEQKTAQNYLAEHHASPEVSAQLLFLATGSATELKKLVEDQEYQQAQLTLAATAKQLISASTFEKITIVQKMTGDRERTLTVLRLALQMLTTLAPQQAEHKTALDQLRHILKAYEQISQNGNIKIQLLQAVL